MMNEWSLVSTARYVLQMGVVVVVVVVLFR